MTPLTTGTPLIKLAETEAEGWDVVKMTMTLSEREIDTLMTNPSFCVEKGMSKGNAWTTQMKTWTGKIGWAARRTLKEPFAVGRRDLEYDSCRSSSRKRLHLSLSLSPRPVP
jgi:hypothetical protein